MRLLSYKYLRFFGDVWGEMFRAPKVMARFTPPLDAFSNRFKFKMNARYYRLSYYVGRFGVIRRRKTRYGQGFVQKQRLKLFYGWLPEKRFRFYWHRSLRHKNFVLGRFLHFLESRLDIALVRSNFAFNLLHA